MSSRVATIDSVKLPPHSVEAEQSVIGGLLLDNEAWLKVSDLISDRSFYRDDHRRIFRHIAMMLDKDRAADVVTVFESIENAHESEHTGGLPYLAEIANSTPSAANIRHYATIVREKSILRSLIGTCDEISGNAFSTRGRDVDELLDDAERKIFQIAEMGARTTKGTSTLATALGEVVTDIRGRLRKRKIKHVKDLEPPVMA